MEWVDAIEILSRNKLKVPAMNTTDCHTIVACVASLLFCFCFFSSIHFSCVSFIFRCFRCCYWPVNCMRCYFSLLFSFVLAFIFTTGAYCIGFCVAETSSTRSTHTNAETKMPNVKFNKKVNYGLWIISRSTIHVVSVEKKKEKKRKFEKKKKQSKPKFILGRHRDPNRSTCHS